MSSAMPVGGAATVHASAAVKALNAMSNGTKPNEAPAGWGGFARPSASHVPPVDEAELLALEPVEFDPTKHLAPALYPTVHKPKVTLMGELGYGDVGISPVGVSEPFQLFTAEAVQQMRKEIYDPVVLDNFGCSSNIAGSQVRGYASKYHALFAYDAWMHPATLAAISSIAGVNLVPSMDYEVGHINLMVKDDTTVQQELVHAKAGKHGTGSGSAAGDKPIVGWHTDSYPFVVVLMLSDCTNMVGGETAIRTPSGEIRKVRGPGQGCAVVMQGRYITHQALRAVGVTERTTSVTSFRPASPLVKDDTVLTTIRPVSNLSELYYQYADYRLDILEERVRKARKSMNQAHNANKRFDSSAIKAFLQEQLDFLTSTDNEIVEESKVKAGELEIIEFPEDKPSALADTQNAHGTISSSGSPLSTGHVFTNGHGSPVGTPATDDAVSGDESPRGVKRARLE